MTVVDTPRSAWPVQAAKRLAHRDAPTGFSAVLAWTALASSVLAGASLAAPIGWPAKFAVLLLFVCAAPGGAIVSYVQLGDPVPAATVALVMSLAISAAGAVTMVWTKAWHPLAGLAILASLSGVVAAIRLLPMIVKQPSPAPVAPQPRRPLDGGELTSAPPAPAFTALASGSATVLTGDAASLPLRRGLPDATSVIPAIRPSQPDETSVIPAVRPSQPDETSVIPAVRPSQPDETSVILAVRPSQSDDTSVIPAVQDLPADNDHTSVLPVLPAASGRNVRDRPAPQPVIATGPSYAPIHICFLLAAAGLWIYALTQTSTANVNAYGMLSVMQPGFYAALLICVVGFVTALTARRLMPLVLVAYIVLLVLIMHATLPAVLANPEYAWTLRHVGVIEFIRSLGGVDNRLDIYQEWPTFFALMAQLVTLSGAHTMTVAGWAPVFFDLADCVPLFAIARTLSSDRRVPYLTVFTFTAINWVAQDYLSPQAFAFLLCLGILMTMLRWLRRMPSPARPVRPRALARLWAWLQDGLVEVPYTSKAARRLSLTVLYVVYAVVVASHQLSPYLIAASAVSLVVLGLIKPVRIIPILVGIAVGYVVPRYQVVDSYGIFDGLNFLNNASGVGPKGPTAIDTPGREFSVKVVETLALSVWGLTATSVFAFRRRLGPVALPGVLAFAPFVMLAGQSYGGEAIYRVFLFSSPWCAYLLAHSGMVLVRKARSAGARRLANVTQLAVGGPVLIAMVLASLLGAHGQLSFNQFTTGEVNGVKYLYATAPQGADIVYASSNYPGKLTARYGDIVAGRLNELTFLSIGPGSDVDVPEAPDISAIDVYFRSLESPVKYMVFSKSMIEYAHYFGYLPDGVLATMNNEVGASPLFTLIYQANGIWVYRYVGAASTTDGASTSGPAPGDGGGQPPAGGGAQPPVGGVRPPPASGAPATGG